MKLAVFFPGIGYTVDRPLLYYSKKLAKQYRYEVRDVCYQVPEGKPEQAFAEAFAQTEQMLSSLDWTRYEEILFVSKSLGTVVSCAYAEKYHITCRNVYYTPLEQTFSFHPQPGIVFHGTADPWVKTALIREKCEAYALPLHITEGTNHSLELPDKIGESIQNLKKIMELTERYIADGTRG